MKWTTTAICAELLLSGGASTDAEITKSRADTRLPYPSQILVHDSAISPLEVSPDSVAAGRLSGAGDRPLESAGRRYLERQVAAIV